MSDTTSPDVYVGMTGKLLCCAPGTPCGTANELACDHVLTYMHENRDAPLESGSVWVVLFKTVQLPNGAHVTPFEIETIVRAPDAAGIREVEHYDGASLTLIGPHDGRYCIRTALMHELHSIEANGQLPCSGQFHDARFDREYLGQNMQRARLVDSYYRHYLGVCYSCHARSQDPGNLSQM